MERKFWLFMGAWLLFMLLSLSPIAWKNPRLGWAFFGIGAVCTVILVALDHLQCWMEDRAREQRRRQAWVMPSLPNEESRA